MNKKLIGLLIAGGLVMTSGTHAAVDKVAAEALAKKSACLACHAVDKKIVGPSYRDVATRYKGDKTAEAKLIEKVKNGGSGVWGAVQMPPSSPRVKDEDIKTLVQWVLSIK